MGDALFRKTEDGYRVAFPASECEFVVDRIRWERDELFTQLSVSCGLVGAKTVDGVLSFGTFNLSSPRAAAERAKYLSARARTKGLDFEAMLEEVRHRVLTQERRGDPAIHLRTVRRPAPDAEFDVDGQRFPKDYPTIAFGDGGSLKSMHALHMAGTLAQRGVKVALFDWEMDEYGHRERLERDFGPDMPDVLYVRCTRPLVYEVDRCRRLVREEQIAFAIFDSVAYACGGPPEAAEHAMAYWRAVGALGIGSYHIAHVRQGDGNDLRPFGSAFWHNSARSTWFVKLASTSADGKQVTIGLINRKANLSKLYPAVGFEVTFDAERTVFRRVSVADVDELAESLPLWQRMRQAVSHEPKTLARLADELGASVETLDRTVRRRSQVFTRVSGDDDHVTRIALVSSREPDTRPDTGRTPSDAPTGQTPDNLFATRRAR